MWNQWIICDHKIKEYLMEIGNWCWHYAMTGICTQHRDMQSLQGHQQRRIDPTTQSRMLSLTHSLDLTNTLVSCNAVTTRYIMASQYRILATRYTIIPSSLRCILYSCARSNSPSPIHNSIIMYLFNFLYILLASSDVNLLQTSNHLTPCCCQVNTSEKSYRCRKRNTPVVIYVI